MSFVSGISQAAINFSFGNNNKNDTGNSPRTTSNRPWGNIGPYTPGLTAERNFSNSGNGYNYSYSYSYSHPNQGGASDSGYYLGGAPGTGWPSSGQMAMPGSYNPFGPQQMQMPQGSAGGQPYVEVEIAETAPFEQQNILYTARVVSTGNIRTLDPILPRIDGAALEKVDGPSVSVRNGNRSGGREIINSFRFKLTPLRSGEITIPPIRFEGTHASSSRQRGRPGMTAPGRGGGKFTISSERPVNLDVQAAQPAVTPWLPLHNLHIQMEMQSEEKASEGIPVTLTLELVAKGAMGEQLPSLEQQLKSDKFRIYRESTTIKNGVSKDGEYLIGSRKETYTLIPLQDGWIRLPRLGVAWWDVDSNTPEMAGLPGQAPDSFAAGSGPGSAKTGEAYPSFFWYPLLIVIGLIAGYWIGAWARTRPLLKAAGDKAVTVLAAVREPAMRHTRSAARALSLTTHFNKLRMNLAVMMPRSAKVWMCSRCISQEDNPRAWCQLFREKVCRHLKMSPHTPLPMIAEKIIESNPQAEPVAIRSLVQSLDGAIYGGKDLDFLAWKRDLNNQLRPRARLHRRHRHDQRAGAELPKLNPRVA